MPETPGTSGLTAQPPLGTHLAGHPGDLVTEGDSCPTIVLMVVFSSRISLRASTSIFLDRSPRATAVVTWAICRTCPVRLDGHAVDRLGEVLPRARHARHPGLAAQDALGAHLAGDPGDLDTERARAWSTIVLMVSASARPRRGPRR